MSDLSCSNENLSGYLDGELSSEEAKAIENHLQNCAHCRETLNRLQALSSVVRQFSLPVASPLLTVQILNRIQSSERYSQNPINKLLQSWGLLSLFFLGTVVILFGSVLFEVISFIVKHLATVTSLMVKLSWQLPLDRTNLAVGLILTVGAIGAFYGFGRVYSALSREELIS
ncbi:MAG: hypothetical protein A4E52_01547 [Pelotomaculum sp. PtaB.Bin013]|uniref:Anti-sigma-W factor RsiW n=1 Tax=Pelotomaculum isophthalicicum JI TaxID=947010 RepID=A0A9X4JWB1_9FIRM|nr:zf-HC2 domain-containing protein [Pelotomaculum isophthalicicum]MDF9408892.1 zf-HC2 domain-containing protein [Pelotomaculum isophthalicicum JI]OPX86070.1 MAG: hypothetical protein A4E52_01547 [Pelotomaculum sp. PtaB.Bin013]